MLEPVRARRILAWREPVDMRKSFDGLIGLVRDAMIEDPLSGSLYVFAKRLDRGRFVFPDQDTPRVKDC